MTFNLFDYLDKLRQRPEAARRRIAVLSSLVITLLIGTVWLLNFKLAGSLVLPPAVSGPETALAEPPVGAFTGSGPTDGSIIDRLEAAGSRIQAGWQMVRQYLAVVFSP